MNISSLAARSASLIDSPRVSSTGAKQLSGFSMEGLIERLAHKDAVKPAASRQISAAALSERQVDAAAAADPPSSSQLTSQLRPFYIANADYDATDPASQSMVADPSATATPQPVQWTSPNGLTTTGVMNPFGLTKNNPGIGFYGAPGVPK